MAYQRASVTVVKRRFWKLDEERTLVEMYAAGAEAEDIAKSLGRTTSSVTNYIDGHRERLKLPIRRARWTRAENLLIQREVDMAIKRIMFGTPRRSRSSIAQHMVEYLYGEPKRQRRAAATKPILDLGGMNTNLGGLRKQAEKSAA